jgi:hypothetical protein
MRAPTDAEIAPIWVKDEALTWACEVEDPPGKQPGCAATKSWGEA